MTRLPALLLLAAAWTYPSAHTQQTPSAGPRLHISAVAFDPGNVRTSFATGSTSILRFVYRTPLARLLLISPEQGGENLTFFADGSPGTTWEPGTFYTERYPATPDQTNPLVRADLLVDLLWERSEAMLSRSR